MSLLPAYVIQSHILSSICEAPLSCVTCYSVHNQYAAGVKSVNDVRISGDRIVTLCKHQEDIMTLSDEVFFSLLYCIIAHDTELLMGAITHFKQ